MRSFEKPLVLAVAAAAAFTAPLFFGSSPAAAAQLPGRFGPGPATLWHAPPPGHGLTTLHFSYGSPDSWGSQSGVTIDKAGNIFGATVLGGTYGYGSVFELSPAGGGAYTESVVHSFDVTDGNGATGVPMIDKDGNLWVGTIAGGTPQDGTIVELSPSSSGYTESQLYQFDGTAGASPAGGFLDRGKVFYGTTAGGGKYGYGTIVSVKPNLTVTDLYDFVGPPYDGANPVSNLVLSAGAYYGTTSNGGYYNKGTVFRFVPGKHGPGTLTVLWNFADGYDGAYPDAGVIVDAEGNVYGTTLNGGDSYSYGDGIIFKLTPSISGYQETILHHFSISSDGANPAAGLTFKGRYLYGTTHSGGLGDGTIYRIMNTGADYAITHEFQGYDGAFPYGTLLSKGTALYGTTYGGAGSIRGTVFKYVP